jgi:hypothetical protein
MLNCSHYAPNLTSLQMPRASMRVSRNKKQKTFPYSLLPQSEISSPILPVPCPYMLPLASLHRHQTAYSPYALMVSFDFMDELPLLSIVRFAAPPLPLTAT